MLYEKLMSVHNALGALSHRVDKETWAVIKIARNELMDAADIAQEMTEHLTCPRKPSDKSNDKQGMSGARGKAAKEENNEQVKKRHDKK